jgi:small conductance mechanosensitive channel
LRVVNLIPVAKGVGTFAAIAVVAVALRAVVHTWMGRRQVRSDMAVLVDRVVYYGLIALAVVVGLAVGFGETAVAFNGVLVAALLTGLGLSDLFKNYVSGFYVLFERHVKPGDVIETQGYAGVVTDVKLRVTLLRNEEGQLIVIPNADLFTKPVKVGAEKPPSRKTPRG